MIDYAEAQAAVSRARREFPLFWMLEDVISDLLNTGHVPLTREPFTDLKLAYELAKRRTLN